MTLSEARDALKSNNPPTRLELCDLIISPWDAKHLAADLEDNHTLELLNLSGSKIGNEGVKDLAAALKDNHTLKCLNLTRNSIEDVGALVTNLKGRQSLTELNLYSNHLGPAGGKAIASLLKDNHTLKYLNLAYNMIFPGGAKALAATLLDNHTLTHLNMAGNCLGDSGAKHFAKLLKSNSTLKVLNLCSNGIRPTGIGALASTLVGNHTLTLLDLSYNEIGPQGATFLASLLKDNHTLTALELDRSDITTPEILDEIKSLVERNNATQAMIKSTLAHIENPKDSQPDPFDHPERSSLIFKTAKEKLDAIKYPVEAIGYIKIHSAMTLLEAKHLVNQGNLDAAIAKLSTVTSGNPYFEVAQKALVEIAVIFLGAIDDKEERHRVVKSALASVLDSNGEKAGIMRMLNHDKKRTKLHAYEAYMNPSSDEPNNEMELPAPKKQCSNKN
jgi:hypothetical protein